MKKSVAQALTALRAEIADWNERVKVERTEDVGKAAPALAQHGGERTKADEQGSYATLKQDRGAAYLAARIKRDAPEIAARPPSALPQKLVAAARCPQASQRSCYTARASRSTDGNLYVPLSPLHRLPVRGFLLPASTCSTPRCRPDAAGRA